MNPTQKSDPVREADVSKPPGTWKNSCEDAQPNDASRPVTSYGRRDDGDDPQTWGGCHQGRGAKQNCRRRKRPNPRLEGGGVTLTPPAVTRVIQETREEAAGRTLGDARAPRSFPNFENDSCGMSRPREGLPVLKTSEFHELLDLDHK